MLRLNSQAKPHVLDVLERLIPSFDEELLAQKLWIVSESIIRIRG